MEATRVQADPRDSRDALSAALEGELDRAVYGERLREIRQSFTDSPRDVVVDCAKLTRISPMAVAALVRLQEFVEAEGRSFRLVNASSAVATTFSRGGLEPGSALPGPCPPSGDAALSPPSRPRLAPATPEPEVNTVPAAPPVPSGGANLAGEVERLKRDLALMEADLVASKEEVQSAAGDREKAQSLYVELRARVEALREENRKLADEQEAIRQRSADALAPMREVQKRIRASLEQARVHADSLSTICRGVEEALLMVGVSLPAEDAGSDEPPLSHLILSAMVKMDPEMGALFKSLRSDLLAADEKIRRQAALFTHIETEKPAP